jgi:hypothetical protein
MQQSPVVDFADESEQDSEGTQAWWQLAEPPVDR